MRKSIHEIILDGFDLRTELQRIDNLFFDRDTIPTEPLPEAEMCTMYRFAKVYFNKWPFTGTCIDLEEYVSKLNEDEHYKLNFDFSSVYFEDAEMMEIAFGNTEFYYNMYKFIENILNNDADFQLTIQRANLSLFYKMGDVLNVIINHIYAKPIELETLKYILIPNNEEAIAVAECVENLETSKIILKYNHFKTKGDLQAKKSILRHLFTDIEKEGARSAAMKDFCCILNKADIRHNNTGKNGKSITTGMTDEQIEEVYDVAYRLYLMAKLDEEYEDMLKDKVKEYKSRIDE